MRPNYEVLGRGFYLVRTQAGFKQAIKHRFANSPSITEEKPSNWPRSYPAVVSITTGYEGYYYPDVNWMPLNELFAHIDKSIDFGPEIRPDMLRVEPYGFDNRINWQTYIITLKDWGVFGFCDKMPLSTTKEIQIDK